MCSVDDGLRELRDAARDPERLAGPDLALRAESGQGPERAESSLRHDRQARDAGSGHLDVPGSGIPDRGVGHNNIY